jgi:hypothetical protein
MCFDLPISKRLNSLEIVLILHEYPLLPQRNPMRHPVGQRFGFASGGEQELKLP